MRLRVVTAPEGQQIADMEMACEMDDGWYVGAWTIPFASSFYATIVAEDEAGNHSETPLRLGWLTEPFGAPHRVLVCESIGSGAGSLCADVLDSMQVPYDLWNARYIGSQGLAEVIPHYANGLIIVRGYTYGTQEALGAYLDEGGALFLPDVDVGWFSLDFLRHYFHTETYGGWAEALQGVPGDPITDGLCATFQRDADALCPAYPAMPLFLRDWGGNTYGVRVSTPHYRGVALGFDPMDIAEAEARHSLVERIIAWLAPSVVVPHQHNVSAEYLVSPAQPWQGFPATLEPIVAVMNRGPETEQDVSVHFSVQAEQATVHHEQRLAGPLEGFASVHVGFGPWVAPDWGVYDLDFRVELAGDEYPLDDGLQVRLWCGEGFAPAPTDWKDENVLRKSWDFEVLPSSARLFEAATELGFWPYFADMADVDNDGRLDVWIQSKWGTARLLLNRADGVLKDVTERSGLAPQGWWSDAVFLDMDNDGDLDLCVLAKASVLYRNLGDDTFEAASGDAGLLEPSGGVRAGDLDNDGDLDLALLGSSDSDWLVMLYSNRGDGTLADTTGGSGLDTLQPDPLSGWGLDLADLNNDGLLDILSWDRAEGIRVHVNQGGWRFRQRAACAAQPGDVPGVSSLGDFDNDGDLDVLYNGQGVYLYANKGDGTFRDASLVAGPDEAAGHLAAVLGDYDNDGDLDLFVPSVLDWWWKFSDLLRDSRMYVNTGNDNHYLRVALEGTASNRSGIGARIRVVTGGFSGDRKTQIREAGLRRFASSFRYQGPVNAHFGLGTHPMADTVEVRWPSGLVDRLLDVPADQLVYVREGDYPTPVGEEAEMPLPTAYALFQNFPNPFNPATAIAYDLPEPGHVRLDLYNIIGQHVATLVSAPQKAGRHTALWDAGTHASGVFVYRLEAGHFEATKRMVLLK